MGWNDKDELQHINNSSISGKKAHIDNFGTRTHNILKGSRQKRFSGFCSLRGGVPPLSAKEKIFLFAPLIFR